MTLAAGTQQQSEERRFPLGTLALAGASISLVFCYAQVLIALVAPLLGFAVFEFNIHVQAVFMWLFGLVTVYGLFSDRRSHGGAAPLTAGLLGVVIIAGTLYSFYDVRILIIGYVLLVIAALLNQIEIVKMLKRRVERQSEELQRLNRDLESEVEEQVGKNARLQRLKRFLAPEVVDIITSEGKEDLLESHRRYIACLFCDIRDFTALSNELEPEEVMEILSDFHEVAGRLVAQSNGTIGYRAGDGLMVFFNDPLPSDNPSADAARLALQIKAHFEQARKGWAKMQAEPALGIGIASGYATLGFVGETGRRDYTAIGNAVNIAARLCDQAAENEILIAARALADLGDGFDLGAPRELELKGVKDRVSAQPLLSERSSPAT